MNYLVIGLITALMITTSLAIHYASQEVRINMSDLDAIKEYAARTKYRHLRTTIDNSTWIGTQYSQDGLPIISCENGIYEIIENNNPVIGNEPKYPGQTMGGRTIG